MVLWALDSAPPEDLDGAVLDWGTYRRATR
jgi:hypothetical protein